MCHDMHVEVRGKFDGLGSVPVGTRHDIQTYTQANSYIHKNSKNLFGE